MISKNTSQVIMKYFQNMFKSMFFENNLVLPWRKIMVLCTITEDKYYEACKNQGDKFSPNAEEKFLDFIHQNDSNCEDKITELIKTIKVYLFL